MEDDVSFARAVLERLPLAGLIEHVSSAHAARTALAARHRDVVVADVRLGRSDEDGCEVIGSLDPPPKGPERIVCTAYRDAHVTHRARLLNAAYIQKFDEADTSTGWFAEALELEIRRALARRRGMEARKREVIVELCTRLTPCEAKVITAGALGATTKDISTETSTSVKTVEKHITRGLKKLRPITRQESIRALEKWVLEQALFRALRER